MWEVQRGQAGHGSAAGPSCSTCCLACPAVLVLGGCPRHCSCSQLLEQDTLPGLLFPGEMVEVQLSEQRGWQCHAASSAVLSLGSPSALAVSPGERLGTRSCCPRSRAVGP